MKVKNQKKALWYLILGLGICSGIPLVNRFLIEIPGWLAIVLLVVVVIPLMFMGYLIYFKKK